MKILLLIILLFIPTAFGQILSPEATKVPPLFKGNDAKLIAQGLLDSPLRKRKDEFETTAAYEKRINNQSGTTLADRSNAASTLIFRFNSQSPSSLDRITQKYDADSELLNVSLRPTPYRDVLAGGEYLYSIPLASSD